MTNDYQVFDLKTKMGERWLEPFSVLLQQIKNNGRRDKLKNNYSDLDQKLNNYDCFNVVVSQEKIIAFSAMHTAPFPTTLARVLSRLYYVPEVRAKTMRGRELPSIAVKYMLPYQMKLAQDLQKEIIFLSFQGLNRRPFCQTLAQTLSEYFKQDWQLEPLMHNTVRRLPDGQLNMEKAAWHNIVSLRLNKSQADFLLPSMTIQDWRDRFLQ